MVTDLVVGRYEILEGAGEKKKAIDRLTGREVMVRSKPLDGPPSEELLEKLVRLRHPNLASFLHHFPIDGERLMITEFVDGPSLESLLGESNPIEPGRAQTWISAMVEATQAAHEAGLLVGELSPSKVILGNGEELKVMDAGFSGLPADPASVQTELSTLAAIYRRMLGDAAALANPALPKLEASENCAEMLAALKESQVAAPAPTEPADRKPLPKRKSLLKFRKMDRRYVIAIIATLIGIAIGYKVATHGQSEDGYITRWIQSFF